MTKTAENALFNAIADLITLGANPLNIMDRLQASYNESEDTDNAEIMEAHRMMLTANPHRIDAARLYLKERGLDPA